MKGIALILVMASMAFGQSQTKPAAPAAKTARSASTPTAAAKSDLPVFHGVVKPLFTERYEDIKIGTGAVAEPLKIYHVTYTGYLASTGQKFDSSFEHRAPLMKDGKAVTDADGKPVLADPQPIAFPQGLGRLIPGFDQGFVGMRIGGKRRIFIPWQLAYGTRDMPAREGHPGIPPKSDLIFDVELVDVTDLPAPPPVAARPAAQPAPSGQPVKPTTPPVANTPATPPAASSAPQAPSSPAPAAPPQPK